MTEIGWCAPVFSQRLFTLQTRKRCCQGAGPFSRRPALQFAFDPLGPASPAFVLLVRSQYHFFRAGAGLALSLGLAGIDPSGSGFTFE
jgi:hypothetical protein